MAEHQLVVALSFCFLLAFLNHVPAARLPSLSALQQAPVRRQPMHPKDYLQLLPSVPGEGILGNPTDILPEYIGSLIPGQALNWSGPCFNKSFGYVTISDAEGTEKSEGAVVHLEMADSQSWLCMDLYAFATPYRITGDFFFFKGHHKFGISWLTPAEQKYVMRQGLAVFLMPKGFLGTVRGMWDVLPLLSNSWIGEAAQLAFLERRMGAEFVQRKKPWVTSLDQDSMQSIQSGDFIVTSKVRGPWGCFETLQKWVSGSWSGHTAMFMRHGNGTLYVAESGHYNEAGDPIIAVMPFWEWWEAQLKDAAEPHIAILPLHSSVRAHFNETAAWEFVRYMEGRKFGYHNIIFSWIDTPDQNFPPPINSQLLVALGSMWIRIQPEYAGNIVKEALNKRLNTNGLEFPAILEECTHRGMTFGDLLAIPEQDDWVYSDGISTSCIAFVMSTWKAAGVLGPLAPTIQATEFTIRDAYNLQIFEDDLSRLPPWCNENQDPPLPYCQVTGKWRFDLPGFNTQKPYPHMNEHCPSMPPEYSRPSDC